MIQTSNEQYVPPKIDSNYEFQLNQERKAYMMMNNILMIGGFTFADLSLGSAIASYIGVFEKNSDSMFQYSLVGISLGVAATLIGYLNKKEDIERFKENDAKLNTLKTKGLENLSNEKEWKEIDSKIEDSSWNRLEKEVLKKK
jgi:hypothetical protein